MNRTKREPSRKRYLVTEQVVFNYHFLVEAESPNEAIKLVGNAGDGEAHDHEEISREMLGAKLVPRIRVPHVIIKPNRG